MGETETDYERLGEVLARLHLVSRRKSVVFPSCLKGEIFRFRQQHRIFARHLPAIKKKGQGIGGWFRERGDHCLLLAEEAWKTFRQPNVLRILRKENPSLIHGDVTRPNVIVNENGVYLIDWDMARRGSAYYEVAKTMNNITNYSVPHVRALLAGYEKQCPLLPEERLIISSLFRLPREAWIAAFQIRLGRRLSVFNILKETWPKRMEVIRWVDDWARQSPKPVIDPSSPPQEGGAAGAVSK